MRERQGDGAFSMGTGADAWRDSMSSEKGVEMFKLVAKRQMNYFVRLSHAVVLSK